MSVNLQASAMVKTVACTGTAAKYRWPACISSAWNPYYINLAAFVVLKQARLVDMGAVRRFIYPGLRALQGAASGPALAAISGRNAGAVYSPQPGPSQPARWQRLL